MTDHNNLYPILNRYRVTIPMRLRFAAEVIHASIAVREMRGPKSRTRQRRVMRLAMERLKRKHMKNWPERNVR